MKVIDRYLATRQEVERKGRGKGTVLERKPPTHLLAVDDNILADD